ncbi:YciI family protein [soil metagenome]
MNYMFLMYGNEASWNETERKECMVECLAVCDELKTQGKFVATSPLQSVSTAATVRVRDGKTLITDGPFAETTEQLGGFFILDLANLDEAIAVAERLPPVRKGTAEIRPLLALEGMPPSRSIPVGFTDTALTPFMFLVYGCCDDGRGQANPDVAQKVAEAVKLCHELNDAGKFIGCSPLYPPATATCVRVRNGKREITDGPFTETNEVLGGYYIVLAESRDAAMPAAARHAAASGGPVEVRPLYDLVGLR